MLLAFLATLAAFSPPEVLTGKVIGVHDGDTCKILVGQRQTTIRLNAIDAPELGQPFGQRSKQALSSMIFGKIVTVTKTSTDRYGRTVGDIRIDGISANEQMITEGWAWHFKKYDQSPKLASLEIAARKARAGLWVDPEAEAPWDYRERQRTPKSGEDNPPVGGGWVHVTTTGKRYHSAGCKHLSKSDSIISFEDAIARGLKPCRECGGQPSAESPSGG